MCLVLPVDALAAVIPPQEMISPMDTLNFRWVIKDTDRTTTSLNETYVYYDDSPKATRAGEQFNVHVPIKEPVDITGSISVSLGVVSAELNFDVTKDKTVYISKLSAPLEVGQYVKIYTLKRWDKWTIKQEHQQIRTSYTYDDNGNVYPTEEITVIDTKTGYVYEPKNPDIRFVYYSGDPVEMKTGSAEIPVKIEDYTWNGEEYVLKD